MDKTKNIDFNIICASNKKYRAIDSFLNILLDASVNLKIRPNIIKTGLSCINSYANSCIGYTLLICEIESVKDTIDGILQVFELYKFGNFSKKRPLIFLNNDILVNDESDILDKIKYLSYHHKFSYIDYNNLQLDTTKKLIKSIINVKKINKTKTSTFGVINNMIINQFVGGMDNTEFLQFFENLCNGHNLNNISCKIEILINYLIIKYDKYELTEKNHIIEIKRLWYEFKNDIGSDIMKRNHYFHYLKIKELLDKVNSLYNSINSENSEDSENLEDSEEESDLDNSNGSTEYMEYTEYTNYLKSNEKDDIVNLPNNSCDFDFELEKYIKTLIFEII